MKESMKAKSKSPNKNQDRAPVKSAAFTAAAFVAALVFSIFAIAASAPPAFAADKGKGSADSYWDESAPRTLLWQILENIETDGATRQNTRNLEKFVRTYQDASMTDEALFRLGRIYMETHKIAEAIKTFQNLLENFPASDFKLETLYGLAYCQYRNGKTDEAVTALESIVGIPDSTATQRVRATVLLNTITEITPELLKARTDVAIGALLPLKGPYASFGEDALRGILLAAEVYGTRGKASLDPPTPPVPPFPEIRVIGIDPAEPHLKRHFSELAKDKSILALIGPLLSKTAPEAASMAQRKRVPVIALTKKDALPQSGSFVFRNFLTARQQAEKLAQVAIEVMHLRRFAILYPESGYGTELAKRFKEAIEARGAVISAELSYPDGKKDFGPELKELFALEVEEHMEGRRQIREYTTTVEVDALFIPDYYETIAQIAPYLAYYNINIEEVQLLGANGWNSPRLLELAAKHVEGALIVDSYFGESKKPTVSMFARRFEEVYGYRPGTIEAHAFDAATALIAAIRKSETKRRRSVRDALLELEPIEGATGPFHFDEDGEAVKELFLLRVWEGKILEAAEDELPVKEWPEGEEWPPPVTGSDSDTVSDIGDSPDSDAKTASDIEPSPATQE